MSGRNLGSLQLIVEGVYAADGQVVPVGNTQRLTGAPPCLGQDCLLLPLFFWLKGDRPSLPEGILIGAGVSRTTWFDRALMEKVTKESLLRTVKSSSTGVAKLHLYSLPGQSDENYSTSIQLRLDGKRLGSLPEGQYACISLTPGARVLSVNSVEVEIDPIADQEYYFEIFKQPAGIVQKTSRVSVREGYQFVGERVVMAVLNDL